MRVRVLLCVLLAIAAVAAPAASAGRNPQVAGLQAALRANGFYRGAIDAIRGPLTTQGVLDFQRAHHLRATGHAGFRTRVALGALGRPLYGTRLLTHGAVGWDVAVLQYLLVRRGISVPVDGHFGGLTQRAVQRFQVRAHLPADGAVGPRTRDALAQSNTKTATKRHSRIHVVQAGDTLSALAHRYGTTVAKLARRNHLDPSHYLLVGTRLRVPATGHHHRAATTGVPARTMSIAAVRALLDRWSAHYGVDHHLVRALAWMESGYNNRVVSSTGARGIMQIQPDTWTFVEDVLIGHHVRHGPNGNIHVGVSYLHHLLGDFHGNTRKALAGWYQGEAAVRAHGMYKETHVFVKTVLALSRRM